MNQILQLFSNSYERRSRLYPTLFVCSPGFFLLGVLFEIDHTSITIFIGSLAGCGFLYAIAQAARARGRKVETLLFGDALPSTVLLRHRNLGIDGVTKRRYHAVLAKAIGKEFPTAVDEERNLPAADAMYRSAVEWLKERTRDKANFKIVFEELTSYGFRRNLQGLKPLGYIIAAMSGSIAISHWIAVWLVPRFVWFSPEPSSILILCSFIYSATVGCLLCLVFTERALVSAGYSYAHALLRACDSSHLVRKR